MKQIGYFLVFLMVHLLYAEQEVAYYHNYMWAHFNDLQGNTTVAQKHYSRMFESGAPNHAYQTYLQHLAHTNQWALIVRLMPQLETLFDDLQTQKIFITALEHERKYAEAEKKLLALQEKHKDNAEVTYAVVKALAQKKDFGGALKKIDEFIEHNPTKQPTFLFYYTKAQIFTQLQNPARAAESIKQCMELKPNFDQGWLLFGMIHELQGNVSDALNGYNKALELSGPNPMIEQHILGLTIKQNAVSSQSNFSEHFNNAVNLFRQKEYAQALQAINAALKVAPQHQSARLLKVEILINLKHIEAALHLLKDWILQRPHQEIYYKSLHLLYQAGIEPDNVIKTLYDLEGIMPHNILVLNYLADLYLKQNNNQKALEYLKKALARTEDNHLKTKIYYQMALVYQELENVHGMEQALVSGYKQTRSFAPLNNLLAYHYAHSGKIAEAEKLIQSVIANDNNLHYQDTYAYVLYKKKEYAQAANVLEKIAMNNPQHCCSLLHLGQVYAKLNKKEKAQEYLDKAMVVAHTNKDKQKIAKIKTKL